jgi:hypothetical protein
MATSEERTDLVGVEAGRTDHTTQFVTLTSVVSPIERSIV